MDWLTFFAEIVKALAWPACIAASVFLFRKYFVVLLPRVRTFKIWELQVEFEQELEQVDQATPPQIEKTASKERGALYPQAWRESVESMPPRAAILEFYLGLEGAGDKALKKMVGEVKGAMTVGPQGSRIFKELHQKGFLKEKELTTIMGLVELRNKVAHQPELEVTQEQALKYARLVETMSRHILAKIPQ